MPKKLVQEEMIEQVVTLTKFQVTRTIFPAYSADADHDGGGGSSAAWPPSGRKGKGKGKGSAKKRRTSTTTVSSTTVPAAAKNVYTRVYALTEVLTELFQLQTMPDSIVLQATSMALSTFFEDSKIRELQLSSLGVVRTIFAHYPSHRVVIVDDILVQLGKLPTTKRGLRNFKLMDQQGVQMVSALLMTLVQSCVVPPADLNVGGAAAGGSAGGGADKNGDGEGGGTSSEASEQTTLIRQAHDEGDRTAQTILTSFIDKCSRKADECDYKTLFENVIEDLLRACFQPEWPAAEQLLYFLVLNLLRLAKEQQKKDSTMRLVGLEALGNIAAKVQTLLLEVESTGTEISEFASELRAAAKEEKEERGGVPRRSSQAKEADGEEAANVDKLDQQAMQNLLLDCLRVAAGNDASLEGVRSFYAGQWVSQEYQEVDKNLPTILLDDDDATRREAEQARERIRGARVVSAEGWCAKVTARLAPATLTTVMAMRRDQTLCRDNMVLATKYLGSKRMLSRGFDNILKHIVASLNEADARIRTKALKALATTVDADWTLLGTPFVKKAVEARFQDKQISVREAAIDLVGRFVLSRPDLTDQYYTTFINRTLDTGLSVRKRVIKVLRDICIQQPNFARTPEICLKLLRRVNDVAEGIQDLVTKSFHQIWFSAPDGRWPSDAEEKKALIRTRAVCITKVLSVADPSTRMQAQASFEQLLKTFVGGDDSAAMLEVCRDMVTALVNRIIELEENAEQASPDTVRKNVLVTFLTLSIFCQASPGLLVDHIAALWPHLQTEPPKTTAEAKHNAYILYYTAKILSTAIPRRKTISTAFLKQVEEKLVNLILTATAQSVVDACVECLGSCVGISKNMEIATHTLRHFYEYLKNEVDGNHTGQFMKRKPFLLRSLFVSGLFCRHFDFSSADQKAQPPSGDDELMHESIRDIVFMVHLKFAQHDDAAVRLKALTGFGFFSIRHPHFMLRAEVQELYKELLTSGDSSLKTQVLENLRLVLVDEERRMTAAAAGTAGDGDGEGRKRLADMGGDDSGCTGVIVTHLEANIQGVLLSRTLKLRQSAFSVTKLMLRQGLVHPMEHVSHLVALSTDEVQPIRESAQQQLSDLNGQFQDFVSQKAVEGGTKAFEFRRELLVGKGGKGGAAVRGIWPLPPKREPGTESALLSHLYTLLRSKKSTRRQYLQGVISRFRDSSADAGELLFLADNLAHFPYVTNEEPLFVIHEISSWAAIGGTQLQGSFRTTLKYDDVLSDAEDEDDLEGVVARVGSEVAPELCSLAAVAQSMYILLKCKQYLQQTMGFTEARCEAYSLDEPAKANDSKVRRQLEGFVSPERVPALDTPEGVARQYIQFRDMMQHGEYDFDAENPEDDEAAQAGGGAVGEGTDSSATASDGGGGASATPTASMTKKKNKKKSKPASATKRKAAAGSATKKKKGSSSKKAASKKKPAAKKKQPKRKKNFEDSSDDDDDDWVG